MPALKRKALLTADNQRELAKRRRAMEFVEETLQRQEQDRTHRASMRASETQEQTLERQEQNKMCMASMRASEMQQQTLERQEQNKIRTTCTLGLATVVIISKLLLPCVYDTMIMQFYY